MHELEISSDSLKTNQSLTFSETVGWVRHIDMSAEYTIPSAGDAGFWNEHGVGIDLFEHTKYPVPENQKRELDHAIEVETAPRTILGIPLIPNFSRVASLSADPKYDDNPAYQALLERLQEEFPMPRALQAEGTEPT